MRDGEDEGRGRPLPAAIPAFVDDPSLDTPNCAECLTRMEIEESASGEPYWSCRSCGLVSLV